MSVKKFKNFWEKLITFWENNLEENYKQVSVSFGVMLALILTALIPPVSAWFQGRPSDWGTFWTTSFVGFIQFLIFLAYSFFGKKSEENTIID